MVKYAMLRTERYKYFCMIHFHCCENLRCSLQMYLSLHQKCTKEFLLTKHTQFLEQVGGTTTPELQSLRDSINSCVFQEDNALPRFHRQVTDCFTELFPNRRRGHRGPND